MFNEIQQERLLANLDAEQAILGAVLLDPKTLDDIHIKPDHFYYRHHKNIFYYMQEIKSKGQEVDVVSLVHRLGAKIEDVGGVSYLTELASSNYTSNVSQHQRIVIDLYKRREQLRIAQEMMKQAIEGVPEEVTNNIINDLTNLESNNSLDDEDDGHISKVLAKIVAWSEKDHGEMSGAATGFRDLDKMLGGLQRKNLALIAARPSVGKTALAGNICQNYALAYAKGRGGPVCIFSIEMSDEDLAKRMLSAEALIQGEKMRNPQRNFETKEWTKMYASIGELSNSPMHIFEESGIDINYIKRKSKMIAEKYPGEHLVIMIDYIQQIKGDPRFKGNRNLEMGQIAEELKGIAKTLDCTVIGLSQLSRENEKRQDKRPMMSDLRDGGGIEQAGDVIIMLHRDDYYDKETENKGIIELIIAKHRNGATGTVELGFKKEISKFINIG